MEAYAQFLMQVEEGMRVSRIFPVEFCRLTIGVRHFRWAFLVILVLVEMMMTFVPLLLAIA